MIREGFFREKSKLTNFAMFVYGIESSVAIEDNVFA